MYEKSYKRVADAYAQDVKGMTKAEKRSYLHEELAAESCFDVLSNDGFLREFQAEMSKTEEGRNFLEKLAQFFADLAKRLKKVVQSYAGRTNNEMVRELVKDAKMLDHINTRFREILEGVVEAPPTGIINGNTIKFSRMNDKSFAENVNDILTMSDADVTKNKEDGNFVRIMKHTPKVILDNVRDAEDREIIISFHSLYLETSSGGILEGNYHGLGKEIITALPQYLSNPDAIVRKKDGRLNLYAVVTEGKKKNRVVSIEINTVKDINRKNQKYHLVITIFPTGNNYVKNDIAKNGDYIEYKKEGLAQVNPQLHESLATINAKPSTTIIPDAGQKSNTPEIKSQRTLDTAEEADARLLMEENEALRAQVDAVRAEYRERIKTLRSEKNAKHDRDLSALRDEKNKKIAELRADRDEKIAALQRRYRERIADLRALKDEKYEREKVLRRVRKSLRTTAKAMAENSKDAHIADHLKPAIRELLLAFDGTKDDKQAVKRSGNGAEGNLQDSVPL